MDDTHTFSSLRVITEDLQSHPLCPHGPALLFARTIKPGRERKFYACSACRSRKDCSFFMWEDEKNPKESSKLKSQRNAPNCNTAKMMNRLSRILKLPENKRGYCYTCNCLFSIKEKEKHADHELLMGVSDYQMSHPSELLKQLECSKKEAQYMFSFKSADFIYKIVKELSVTHVLCIGAPRIHERMSEMKHSKMTSLLLDIDGRYHSFYGPDQFCHYNMFNNHFFDGKHAQKTFKDMVQDTSHEVAVVIDPPFGGRVEPLAFTLNSIQRLRQDFISSSTRPMPVLWVFPYFMEPYIQGLCPNFTMLDYKVDYENHSKFKDGSNKRGSAVRIFTNVPPGKITLPEAEGYHHCAICDRWVAPENKHCRFCNACTSKDGRTYIHCKICKRCVKPSWVHCMDCGRCCLPKHNCGQEPSNPIACFCGSPSHLSKECPLQKPNAKQLQMKKRKICQMKEVKKRKRHRSSK